MQAQGFLDDLRRKPEVLKSLAARLRTGNPWADVSQRTERVVLLGMGSSMYAAGVVAARLRSRGLVAVAELASSDLHPAWGEGALVIAISASGESRETLDALDRIRPGAVTVALTNAPGSTVSMKCGLTVLLGAEPEVGGVACRTYQHTLALLLALEAHLTGEPLDRVVALVEQSAEASAYLLASQATWCPQVSRLLAGPAGSHLAAPARRLGSAQQAALMLREGPRRAAVACEVGDWAHVDVYLTKNTDYRLLVFAGSPWDDGILEWTRSRGTVVVAVGGDFDGASYSVRYPGDDVDDVRLLTEVLVVELVAAQLWLES
jgi:fructoselysine-6-P-deglycase FrlB-like protein